MQRLLMQPADHNVMFIKTALASAVHLSHTKNIAFLPYYIFPQTDGLSRKHLQFVIHVVEGRCFILNQDYLT